MDRQEAERLRDEYLARPGVKEDLRAAAADMARAAREHPNCQHPNIERVLDGRLDWCPDCYVGIAVKAG